jgi:hypothetical protein
MARLECTLRIIAGIAHPQRCVMLLDYPATYVNAEAFNDLDEADERYYRKSFDYWMGDHHQPKRHHGWSQSDFKGKYTECYVFKHVDEAERIYGFLARPTVSENRNREVCVLVNFAEKKTDKTNPADLERAERMRKEPNVQKALNDPALYTQGEVTYKWLT